LGTKQGREDGHQLAAGAGDRLALQSPLLLFLAAQERAPLLSAAARAPQASLSTLLLAPCPAILACLPPASLPAASKRPVSRCFASWNSTPADPLLNPSSSTWYALALLSCAVLVPIRFRFCGLLCSRLLPARHVSAVGIGIARPDPR